MNDAAASSVAPVRYALSFTTGTLLAHEAALLAPLYAQHRDWERSAAWRWKATCCR